jgi:hypothetical protein
MPRLPHMTRGAKSSAGVMMLAIGIVTTPVVVWAAMSAATTAAPTVTSGPSGPTRATAATFTFTDSSSAATFECALDVGTFANCTSPKTYTGLGDGPHTFKVRARTPGKSTSTAATRSWTVDTTAPPAPVFTVTPTDPTTQQTARFAITDAETGAAFQCRLDRASFRGCSNRPIYTNVGAGLHCLDALAVDRAGNASTTTRYCWTVLLNGTFQISGDVTALAPGVSQAVNLTIKNPFNFPIQVTDVSIMVNDVTNNAHCSGSTNLRVAQALLVAVTVPAKATRSLQQLGVDPTNWPRVAMLDLPTSQDGCQGATFTLKYTGTARKS